MIRDRVHRMRTHAAPGREAQARLRGEHRLADLDAAKLGFSPTAIVCAKHLRLEGSWPDLRSQAHRPALEESALDHAHVVWFQDGAELLACLARDAGTDRLGRWWWHLLLGSAPTPDRVAERFVDDPASARASIERIRSTPVFEQFLSYLGEFRVTALQRVIGSSMASRSSTYSDLPVDLHPTDGAICSGISVAALGHAFEGYDHREGSSDSNVPAQALLPRTNLVGIESLDGKPDPLPSRAANFDTSTYDTTDSVRPREATTNPARTAKPRDSSHPLALEPIEATPSPGTASILPGTSKHGEARSIVDRSPDSAPAQVPLSIYPTTQQNFPETLATVFDEPMRSDVVPQTRHTRPFPLASPDPTTWTTEFGGLLFVLDALLAMEWIPDFTRPLDLGIGIPPLEYLLMLGRHRFGRRFAKDPLHEWIAEQLESDPAIGPPPRLPELETRISQSLGFRPRRAIHHLCRRKARMRITSGRVDAEFRLADHPLEIRLSGLDRDPGWIPTAGWDFRFHFVAESA